ncbi:WD repeat-containing protein 47-like isoform X2 [Clavelina lepadiformis]|uniref:WDR47 cross-over region domain-containing protein n=1 Tax=Clavelina lepadiformis TaxID=159417 RepID=A0ABP0F724_CLALP
MTELKMHVKIDDTDILKIIFEFLHSRKLYLTANSLALETGISTGDSLPDPIKTLQKYCFDGSWSEVRSYVQPFANLYKDSFNLKEILFLLLRQRFCELFFAGECLDVESSLKDVVDEIRSVCTEQQYEEMKRKTTKYFKNKREMFPSMVALQLITRSETFQDIVKVLEPILTSIGGSIYCQDDRLVSLLVKGILYDECEGYCCERSLGVSSLPGLGEALEIEASSKIASSNISNTNAWLYYWIRGLDDNIINKNFTDSDLKISEKKVEIDSQENVAWCSCEDQSHDRCSNPSKPVGDAISGKINPGLNDNIAEQTTICAGHQLFSTSPVVEPRPPQKLLTDENETICLTASNVQKVGFLNSSLGINDEDGGIPHVQDSYSAFLEEQREAREQSNELIRKLGTLEEEKEAIMRSLLDDGRESQRQLDGDISKMTAYVPFMKTDDSAVVRAVAFHPREQILAVGSNSRLLKLCRTPPPHLSKTDEVFERSVGWLDILIKRSHVHKGSIYALAWNDHGNLLATCSNDRQIKLFTFDDQTKALAGPLKVLSHHDGAIRDLMFLPGYGSGSVLASGGGTDCVVYTYDCEIDTILHQLSGHSDQILSLYSWRSGMLASASQDRSVRLWDLRSSRCVSVLGFGLAADCPKLPTSVCVDTRGQMMAVGLEDGVISMYDLKAGKTVKDLKVHSDEVRSVRFNPIEGGRRLLSSSYDGTAAVSDVQACLTGDVQDLSKHVVLCKAHKDKVIQCRWHPAGQTFATTSSDQTCLLWTGAL